MSAEMLNCNDKNIDGASRRKRREWGAGSIKLVEAPQRSGGKFPLGPAHLRAASPAGRGEIR